MLNHDFTEAELRAARFSIAMKKLAKALRVFAFEYENSVRLERARLAEAKKKREQRLAAAEKYLMENGDA